VFGLISVETGFYLLVGCSYFIPDSIFDLNGSTGWPIFYLTSFDNHLCKRLSNLLAIHNASRPIQWLDSTPRDERNHSTVTRINSGFCNDMMIISR
jgi:hypothetical protein